MKPETPSSAGEDTAAPPASPDGQLVGRVIAMPADTNPEGDIFGGWLLAQMDLAGSTPAFDLAHGRCATVAVDAMVFHQPVSVGDEVSLYATVLKAGRTSVRVRVEAWKRPRSSEQVTRVTEGVFTYVAIDADRKPRPLPPFNSQQT
ncbi:acyl-CoA thioesterase [Brevundimonas aurifodinae]|uniref:Acyl-CoA thioesterase n=2 Tax=Brevundimonas TaxID=41275 RepID=A0A258FRK3_9CAUL|nr:MAG: acyl-CoA thioesterase [Brevundimonas sp. 12-68-7]OYX34817.1 MAG: acyl-CoA thioesterase [Brevundimonas subvibrioides]